MAVTPRCQPGYLDISCHHMTFEITLIFIFFYIMLTRAHDQLNKNLFNLSSFENLKEVVKKKLPQ